MTIEAAMCHFYGLKITARYETVDYSGRNFDDRKKWALNPNLHYRRRPEYTSEQTDSTGYKFGCVDEFSFINV